MKFWLEDTKELTKSFSLIPNKYMSNTEYYNTLSRITIIISVLLFIIFRNKFIFIFAIVLILIIIIRYKNIGTIENYNNYTNNKNKNNILIKYPNNNLYNSNLLYDLSNKKCNYEISDRTNELNNPININKNYYKYYNNRNNICRKNGFNKYNKFLDFLYPQRNLRFCKEGLQHNCFKVFNNYNVNHKNLNLN